MENNRSKEKAAKYAKVYNRILQMVQEGMYPEGSKLASEPILANDLGVSRSTLRQALALLQEDGVIEVKRGVGNFVRRTIDANATGLEQMNIPIYKSCEEEISNTRIEMLTGISTQYTERIFKRKMPVVLAIHRYYENEKDVIAYCFSHIATDCKYLNDVDLNNDQELLEFIEQTLYKVAHSKRCDIEVVKETDNLHDKHISNISGLYVMIRESIMDTSGDVIVVNKFYIPIEKTSIKIFSNN